MSLEATAEAATRNVAGNAAGTWGGIAGVLVDEDVPGAEVVVVEADLAELAEGGEEGFEEGMGGTGVPAVRRSMRLVPLMRLEDEGDGVGVEFAIDEAGEGGGGGGGGAGS